MGRIVQLTDSEYDWCKDLAQRAGEAKRSAGVVSQRKDPRKTDEELDLNWITSEFAVSKYLGIPYSIDPNYLGGDEYDLDYRNKRLEVKAVTFYKTPYLFKVQTSKLHKQWDVGVLVLDKYYYRTWEIAGFISRSKFDQIGDIQTFYSEIKCVPSCEMEEPEYLKFI